VPCTLLSSAVTLTSSTLGKGSDRNGEGAPSTLLQGDDDEEAAVSVVLPGPTQRWRCAQCGNLTRFDVVRSSRVREFVHLDLAGEARTEETEVLAETVEDVRCRWCASGGSIEVVLRPDAGPPTP
jgi:hypothetical protein